LLESQNGILGSLSEIAPSGSADQVALAPGDRLILYSDGLAEVFNSHNEMLGTKGLEKLVVESAQRPIEDSKLAILNGVTAWRSGPITDDVSLVVVEVR
jgi:phosphoserine phosphatase RsbU/P